MICALDIVLRVAGNENRYSFGPSELQPLNQIRKPFQLSSADPMFSTVT